MELLRLKKRADAGSGAAHKLRRQGLVPGVLYGEDLPSRSFSLSESLVNKILKQAGKSAMLEVAMEGEARAVKAIVHAVQTDPVSGRPAHIDLYQVRMDKILHTEVPLSFTGVAAAVKDLGGILLKQADHLPIECLPADLPAQIEVPLEPLKTFADKIFVKNLRLPAGVKVLLDPEAILLSVTEPRSEAELAELSGEVKADVAAVGVVEKKEKTEGDEEAAVSDKSEEKK